MEPTGLSFWRGTVQQPQACAHLVVFIRALLWKWHRAKVPSRNAPCGVEGKATSSLLGIVRVPGAVAQAPRTRETVCWTGMGWGGP